MSFLVNSMLNAFGMAAETPVKAQAAAKAANDAISAARIAADARIVRGWAIMCGAVKKMGRTANEMPEAISFAPCVYDLNAIATTWGDPSVDKCYTSHNRANRSLKAIPAVFGDTMLVASAAKGGQVIRVTNESKDRGAGGFRTTPDARMIAADWAIANAADEVATFAREFAAIVKKGDKAGAAAYIAAFDAKHAADANADKLSDAQLERYIANRDLGAKRAPIATIIGETPAETPEA